MTVRSRKAARQQSSAPRKSARTRRVKRRESSSEAEVRLSCLPEAKRAEVAAARIHERLVDTMNALHEGSAYGNGRRRVTATRIVHALLLALDNDATTLGPLDREALLVIAACKEKPLSPGDHHDLPFSLKEVKLAYLRVIHAATKGRVAPIEQGELGRLEYRKLDSAIRRKPRKGDVLKRARLVAIDILGDLLDNEAFSSIFGRQLLPNDTPRNLRRMTRAIRWLMKQGMARTPEVARAVLFALGVPSASLKNMFTDNHLRSWQQQSESSVDPRSDDRGALTPKGA